MQEPSSSLIVDYLHAADVRQYREYRKPIRSLKILKDKKDGLDEGAYKINEKTEVSQHFCRLTQFKP